MKKIIKLVSSSLVLSMVLASGVAFAEEVVDDDQKVTGNFTLEKRMYQHDGFGAQWAFDVGSDGLWFVNKEPLEGTYDASVKIRNGAPSNNLVIGNENNDSSIGIGVANPTEKLDVFQAEDGARLVLSTAGDGKYDAPQFTSRRAGSDGSGNPTNTKNKDVMGSFAWRGHDGTDWTGAKLYMMITAVGDWSDSNTGTKLQIAHTPYGTTRAKVALEIKGDADVYIPNGDLYVAGHKMHVPDYVFEDDYNLMPLGDLEKYIDTNNHLPGVTSAKDVKDAGVLNMTGMQLKLLEKVEELTLYTLQQEKKIAKLESMQKRLSTLEALLTNLALDTSNSKEEKLSLNEK